LGWRPIQGLNPLLPPDRFATYEVFILPMFLYSFAWLVALLLSAPWWLWRMATTDKYREGLRERLGLVPARLVAAGGSRPAIWIHAVSVGEVIAVSGLVRELGLKLPGWRVVVSTTTRTGQSLARERFGTENVFYYPVDFAWAVRAYLRALRPRLFVLAETEFWPRMLWECRLAGIPVAVVNARISDRSYPKYLRLRFLWRRILRALTVVLAQSEEDVSRLLAIGVGGERVRVGGNLKYDVRATADSALVDAIRAALPDGAKVLVCGSTLEGEERILLEAWPELVAAAPEVRMILAPRHPERFEVVADLLVRSGVKWARRSVWVDGEFKAGSILLLDSIGELASVYSLALVAFVGGSLVAAGGHNPLEPAQYGVPIVMGHHYENFRGIVEALREQEAIRIVDAEGLSGVLVELLRGGDAAMGVRAREVFTSESGGTARAVEALVALLTGERG
jgi:3-deoxy-D-manno-octulosonic-acid transferase